MTQVFVQVSRIYSSFFAAIKSYNNNPSKFLSYPKQPNYKDKNGRNIVTFPKEAISFKEKGFVKLASTGIKIRTNIPREQIKEIRLVPKICYYNVEIIYEKSEETKKSSDIFVGIDLGVNNLISLASNDLGVNPILINGRIIKSINQYYNKKVAELKAQLPKGQKTSKKIKLLSKIRHNKIRDYLHKSSSYIIKYLLNNNVSKIVIGHNNTWKQNINIGKRNNQNFVYIPFNILIDMLKYKAELKGIEVIVREEAYTSKCSFLDKEDICKQEIYLGNRQVRGLFLSSKGIKINADINGALNILRKETKNQFFNWDLVEDYSKAPIKVVLRR